MFHKELYKTVGGFQIELLPDLTGQLWFLITQIIDKSIVPLTPRRLYHLNVLPELLDRIFINVT